MISVRLETLSTRFAIVINMSFRGKVVLVTGAASGIGAAIAELFVREGAYVVAVDRDAVRLRKLVEKCAQDGFSLSKLVANVAKDDEAKKIVAETIAKHGRLDVLVNCAGIVRLGTILNGDILKAYDEILPVNLRSAIQLTSYAAPHLISSKGNIVNISSECGRKISGPEFLSYAISKAGLSHFTRGTALELAPHGVRVNSVSPGSVRSNILVNAGKEDNREASVDTIPLKRLLEPEEIAELVCYVASDKAEGITGSDYIIDCGLLLNKVIC